MSSNLKYTVLMSVYYKEKVEYLRESIDSMINQTIFPDEFIIIEDGVLPANLSLLIEEYKNSYPKLFTVLKNEVNLGLGPSLRNGILHARNEIIVRMDSDDISKNNRVEKQLCIFNQYPNIGIVGCSEVEFEKSVDNVVAVHSVPSYDEDIRKMMKRRCSLLHPTVVFKKSDVIRAGNYQEKNTYHLYEDYDLFTRMVLVNNVKAYNVKGNLYYMRVSGDFYSRRGGIAYALTALRFKYNLKRRKLISLWDFCLSGLGQAFVCLLPNFIRSYIYISLLRK